jgi:hypothetical protein
MKEFSNLNNLFLSGCLLSYGLTKFCNKWFIILQIIFTVFYFKTINEERKK